MGDPRFVGSFMGGLEVLEMHKNFVWAKAVLAKNGLCILLKLTLLRDPLLWWKSLVDQQRN